jgi:iron complex transport system ATP-binding protein
VEEVVRLGRYSHSRGFFSKKAGDNETAVEQALELTGMTAQRHQSVLTLSGGELQRTFLAQVLAQNPKVLLLDEPTNHLDLIYQKQIFSLIRQWLREPGRAVVSVVHDLSLAKAYGTHAILLQHGKSVASGPLQNVMTPENLNDVYGMNVGEWMRMLLSQWNEEKEQTVWRNFDAL